MTAVATVMMGTSELFQPTCSAYVRYCVGFCIRYAAVAGSLYWFFHVGFKQKWLGYRIQRRFPSRDEVAHEICWSLSNTACTGLSVVLLHRLIHGGRTGMYFAVADHGWAYFALSVLLGIAGYDAWFYWQHRLLHTPWLYRHAHAIHHRVANPTPFATFAHHPIETFMGNAYFILFVVLVPVHPLAFGAVGLAIFSVGIIAHMGYEIYPCGFTRHSVFRWCNTSTHHNMHHSHVGCNYGLCFNYWDRLMGTNHDAYHDTFEAIKARLQSSRARDAVAANDDLMAAASD